MKTGPKPKPKTAKLQRVENWPRKLNAYLQKAQLGEFKFGKHDCCTFAAGAVRAITGQDMMSEFRGKYTTEDNSTEALSTIGQGTLYKTLRTKFGPPVHGASGQRGDVAFFQGCCGIVIGKMAVFLHKDGLGVLPISQVQRAFKVGR